MQISQPAVLVLLLSTTFYQKSIVLGILTYFNDNVNQYFAITSDFQFLCYSRKFCLRTCSYLNLLALLDSKKHIGISKRQKLQHHHFHQNTTKFCRVTRITFMTKRRVQNLVTIRSVQYIRYLLFHLRVLLKSCFFLGAGLGSRPIV